MFEGKVKIEKFNVRNNLGLRSVKMNALLTTQSLANVLDGKAKLPKTMKDVNKVELIEREERV